MVKTILMVTAQWVLSIINGPFGAPSAPWAYSYGETSTAIADAANADPLSHDPDGAVKTAAILIALAKHESDFHPNAIGDHGASLGLFQIQPPTAKVDGTLLLVPRTAAPVAIDLIRTSFRVCGKRPWEERLAWYAAGGNRCADNKQALRASRDILNMAKYIFEHHKESLEPLAEAHAALTP
jgi:hypothetical protein